MHKIDDDIFLSCAVVVDIDCDDVENIVFGSTNGTIKVVNVSNFLSVSYILSWMVHHVLYNP